MKKLFFLLLFTILFFTLAKDVTAETISVSLRKGWNLVSIPVNTTLAKESITCDVYKDYIYLYDPSTKQYRIVSLLEPGKGYWVYSKNDCSFSVSGSYYNISTSLKPGWNMIGSQTSSFSTSNLTGCSIISSIWWYNPAKGDYDKVLTVEPGKGYWIKVSSDCILTTLCSSLNYPSDKWQRVWYVHSTSSCLGNGPDETSLTFDNNWGTGTVAYSKSDDIRFTSSRTINIQTTGTYTFTVGSDDGIRLWVDDVLRIDKWVDRAYTTDSVNVYLTAGNHKVRIDWYENREAARVYFNYTLKSQPPKLRGVDYLDWWTGGPGQYGPGGSGQILYMKQWGCNVVRVVIHPRQASVGFAWDILDDVVNTALRNGMVVVLANTYWAGEPYGVDDLSTWTEDQWQAWLNWLDILTSRYKNMPNVYINIINEPLGLSRTDYVYRMRQGIDKVRAVDPSKTVVVDPRFWDTYFDDIMPLERENIIWDPHYYYYSWMGNASSKEAIRAWFAKYHWDVAIRRGEKVWLGEFNYDPDVINGSIWYRNVMEVCDEDGFLGFASWIWAPESIRKYGLLVDWNGTPSQSGQILMEYLKQ